MGIESAYNLFLEQAFTYGVTHAVIGVISFLAIMPVWFIYARYTQTGDDGLPVTRGGGVAFIFSVMFTFAAIVLSLYCLSHAIAPLATPELWALDRAAAVCIAR